MYRSREDNKGRSGGRGGWTVERTVSRPKFELAKWALPAFCDGVVVTNQVIRSRHAISAPRSCVHLPGTSDSVPSPGYVAS